MRKANPWLLPEGVDELLPAQAAKLEQTRRQLLDTYRSWGYELVITPIIEYLDALLVGTGEDLDLKTFKLIDQLSGRLLGVRADITPQVARIDAHRLGRQGASRLCYLDTVLHTRPDGFSRTRSQLQVGVELYGHAGIASDQEILQLMLATLDIAGVKDFHLDLGHVDIYRSLAQQAQLNPEQECQLFALLQNKAKADLLQLLSSWHLTPVLHDMFANLVDLHGDITVLSHAREILKSALPSVQKALDDIAALGQLAQNANIPVHIDLAELHGYSYHTGLVFAAYLANHGEAIARGGRYDDIGQAFGRARPATGFSADLLALVDFEATLPSNDVILAPSLNTRYDASVQAALTETLSRLRSAGEIVVHALSETADEAKELNCQRHLQYLNGRWAVKNSK